MTEHHCYAIANTMQLSGHRHLEVQGIYADDDFPTVLRQLLWLDERTRYQAIQELLRAPLLASQRTILRYHMKEAENVVWERGMARIRWQGNVLLASLGLAVWWLICNVDWH